MAIRRRRKTLTNLLSTMENRVSAVELRPIKLLTDAQVKAALADEDAPLDGGPDSVAGVDAPNQYKRVTEGYYYSGRVTGGKSRVELYFTANPELESGKTVRVSGIHSLVNGVKIVPMNLTGDFKTVGTDTPPWDGRATYNGKRDTPGAEVDSTVLFDPVIATEYSDKKALIVKSRIASVEATVTTAKVIFTTTNYFKVNDVIYVDMPTDSTYYGLDGLFKVKEVGSNFVTFDFASAIPEPLNLEVVTDERYVHAVAQSAIRDGATYIDVGPDPDVVYVWKDIRWVKFNSADVPKDDNAPGPVTNLEAADENDTPDGSAIGASRVTLTWTAPDVNADNTPIDDLIGYTVWWRQYVTQEWERSDVTGIDTNWSHSGFLQGKPAYFRVFARDSGGNVSTGVDLSYTTGVFAPTVSTPKAPSVSTYLGTIKIAYDDLTAAGLVQAGSAKEIEVYFSDINGFTPGPTNFYGKFPANAGSYIIIPGTEIVDATDYYIKIIVKDIYGNITAPSDQVSIRAKISDIVTFDMIDVGTLTGQVIIGLDIRTSSNPSVNGGIIMNQQGITAYDPSGGQTFRVDATNGQVSIGDYLGTAEAAGLYVGQVDADNTYATIATANGISITANTANSNATSALNTANTANGNATEAITRIEAGTITLTKSKVVSAINQGLSSNTTQISGGSIITNTINADRITAGTITATELGTDSVTGVKIKGGSITATEIVSTGLFGRTIGTATSGKRVLISSDGANQVKFNSATDTTTGQISSTGTSIFFNKSSGAGSGGLELTATQAILSSGAQSAGACGVKQAYVLTNSSSQVKVGCDSGSGALYLNFPTEDFSSGGDRYMIIDYAGKVKYLSGAPNILSDSRLKNLVSDTPLGLEFISKLNPVSFTWKPETKLADPNVKQFGLLAQDVEQALVDSGVELSDQQIITTYGDDSYVETLSDEDSKEQMRTINYTALVPVLIKSTQDLLAQIELLKSEVKELREGMTNGS